MPFDPRSAAKPTPAPFAPGAFMRPAPYPMPVTHLPAGLAGPIFPQVGWHFGPSVYLGEPPYGEKRCQPSPRGRIIGGYGSLHYGVTDETLWAKSDTNTVSPAAGGAMLLGLGALALALPVASSIIFGRKYGGPGYIVGFFVPGAIGALISAVRGQPTVAPAATRKMASIPYSPAHQMPPA